MKEMNVENGNLSFLASIILGVLSWFGKDIDLLIRLITALAAMGTAAFAIVNYYYSIKKNKLEIKKFKEKS